MSGEFAKCFGETRPVRLAPTPLAVVGLVRGTILPAYSMLSCSVGYSTVCHLVAGPRDPMLVPQSIQGDGEKGRRKDERRSVLGAEGRSMIRADMALPIKGCPTPPRGCSGAATPDGESSSRARSGLDPFFLLSFLCRLAAAPGPLPLAELGLRTPMALIAPSRITPAG